MDGQKMAAPVLPSPSCSLVGMGFDLVLEPLKYIARPWYFQDQIESYSHKLTGWTWKHWLERSMAHPCRNHAAER